MNATLVQNWNRNVSKEDTIYFLGDFAFAGTQKIQEILDQLNGRIILIKGNHDRQTSDKRWLELGMTEVHEQLEIEYKGYKFLLCHFPYITGQEGEDTRYLHLRPVDLGISLICGHRHSDPSSKVRKSPKGTWIYDVGVDGNFMKPVSIDSIIDTLCGDN